MRIGIVGSRSFPQLKLVEWFVRDLPMGVTIVSGGASGVDSAAVEYARRRGLETKVHPPDLAGCKEKYEFTERYYARNQMIVDDSNLVVAFTEKDSGGTWDTIKRARKAGKPVKIIRPSALFPGESDQEPVVEQDGVEVPPPVQAQVEDEEPSPQQAARTANKGKGPFAIKRVSLGSYALRRKLYIGPEEWAEIIADKEVRPAVLADKIAPAMIEFFDKNKRLGFIHAITVPPRSKRNLGSLHVMDLVAERVAGVVGCEWVRMFEPWDKSTRGRYAKHGEITITPEVSRYVSKVIWVIDDITTTNFTLRSSVQALMAMEIHAHGLAYILMA
jgi:hypothetical protein